MEVLEAIRTRRSIRSFSDKEIPDEDAIKILEAARWAPSAGNRQPWCYIYVKDKEILRMVKNCSPGFYGEAAAAIVINIRREAGMLGVLDVGFASQNILLAAHALGIGSCAIASFNKEAIRELLEIPEEWDPILIISLGYPDRIPPPPYKKPLSEIVYLDIYGQRWEKLEGRTEE